MSSELSPGDRIADRWRLVAFLGEGAAGSVWRAINEATSREFALKVMRREATRDVMAVQRFMQEARAAGGLRHPGIVEVYDVGYVDKGRPFIVMELLEGESLAAKLAVRPLEARDAARTVAPIARALHHAHEAGIVHRDLKPENIFLANEHGAVVPKVLDFGVSKLVDPSLDPVVTTTGAILGSPGYMSPEQARGDHDVDARADVWALGVLLYRCISGALPFDAHTRARLIDAVETADLKPLRASPRMASLVRRCLSVDRAERPTSALTVATELDLIVRNDRGPMLLVGAGIVAVAVVAALLIPRGARPPDAVPAAPPPAATTVGLAPSESVTIASSSPSSPSPPASSHAPRKPIKRPDRPRQPGF